MSDNQLPACPLCRKPLTVLSSGNAYCDTQIKTATSIEEWKEKSCLLAQTFTPLPIATWKAINAASHVPDGQAAIDSAYQWGLFDAATECEGVIAAERERRNKSGKIILGAQYCIAAIRERARVTSSPPSTTPHEPQCTWEARPSRYNQNKAEWFTTCGVSTEVFNSCAKYCYFCGQSIRFGATHQVSAPDETCHECGDSADSGAHERLGCIVTSAPPQRDAITRAAEKIADSFLADRRRDYIINRISAIISSELKGQSS